MTFQFIRTFSFTALLCLFQTANSHAQEFSDMSISDIPVISADEAKVSIKADTSTHPALHLTPDKSEIIKLDKPAFSVIIGNPNHMNVLVENSQTLIVVPRMQGASHFVVLDNNHNVVMQRHVIVAGEKKNYVRIRRSCSDGNCQPTSVYYCPDNCHEIVSGTEPASGSDTSAMEPRDAASEAEQEPEDPRDQ